MISDSLHTSSLYRNEALPLVMFTIDKEVCTPPGPGYQYLHWHEELQFTIVMKGQVMIQVNGTDYELHEGEAIFINSGLLHVTRKISSNGVYISFNFASKMLSVFSGSTMETDYVLPFTSNYRFPVMCLTKTITWQAQIIDLLYDSIHQYEHLNDFGMKYQISITFMQIWLLLIQNTKASLSKPHKLEIKKQERIQTLLSYIHLNYKNDISLVDIANSAFISVGECCRCFKNTLHTTPYDYLLRFRIDKSTELLNTTNYSISVIAGMVGFNDSSHFIQYYKKIKGFTPNEYRNQLV